MTTIRTRSRIGRGSIRLLCAAALFAVGHATAGAQTPTRPPATTSTELPGVRGVTLCNKDLNLGFPVGGRLAKVAVVEGSEVREGAELAHLDLVAETLEVERRRLQWENGAELRAANARAATAAKQMAAAREIFRSNAGISREELENKELAHALSVAEVERLRAVKAIERVDHLAAQEALARRTLRAPAPGIVTKVIKNVGESIQANETTIRLCDLSKILFTANVPVSVLGPLAADDRVRLQVTTGTETVPVEGRVMFVSPVVDAASGLAEIKVELAGGAASGVRPGLQARLLLGR